MSKGAPTFILASGSPRRKDLLEQAGLTFAVVCPGVEELGPGSLPADRLCLANARMKAGAVAAEHESTWVLASDTVVALEGVVYGKPESLGEAARNLHLFRGRTHQVLTGVVLQRGPELREFVEESQVTFHDFPDSVISRYLAEVPVLDKAGGYAIQHHGEWLVEKVEGDFENIIGLPLTKVLAQLEELGFLLPKTDL